jgi:hypothetical protein
MKSFQEMAADEVDKIDRALEHLAEICGELMTENISLKDLSDSFYDIQESCRDKEAADRIGGHPWANI